MDAMVECPEVARSPPFSPQIFRGLLPVSIATAQSFELSLSNAAFPKTVKPPQDEDQMRLEATLKGTNRKVTQNRDLQKELEEVKSKLKLAEDEVITLGITKQELEKIKTKLQVTEEEFLSLKVTQLRPRTS